MRVVRRVTGRGGCRERGREMGEDNWREEGEMERGGQTGRG